MDVRQFDTLARTLSEDGTRRGLLGLFATLPVLSGLIALMADREETDAEGRRKTTHNHGTERGHAPCGSLLRTGTRLFNISTDGYRVLTRGATPLCR